MSASLPFVGICRGHAARRWSGSVTLDLLLRKSSPSKADLKSQQNPSIYKAPFSKTQMTTLFSQFSQSFFLLDQSKVIVRDSHGLQIPSRKLFGFDSVEGHRPRPTSHPTNFPSMNYRREYPDQQERKVAAVMLSLSKHRPRFRRR